MKRSYNEVVSLVAKAARGAGVPLGQAEDFAQAVGCLVLLTPGELGPAEDYLVGPFDVTVEDAPALTLRGPLVVTLPMAVDALCSGDASVTVDPVNAPLISAYLTVARRQHGLQAKYADGHLRRADCEAGPELTQQAVEIQDAIWASWSTFAARTYVPATAASRESGAGAGLIDND